MALAAWVLAAASGCEGVLEDPAAGPGDPASGAPSAGADPQALECDVEAAPPRQLRRLTPRQYRNTLRDLVGDPELTVAYDDEADVVTERGVRQLQSTAEAVTSRRDHWSRDVFPCDLTEGADESCASDFLETFGSRAFRRPLFAEEREWLLGVYGDAASELGSGDAMEALLQVILQSPQTVYIPETGASREGLPAQVRALTDHELAARLSYFLWDTTPDDELLAAASRDELSRGDGLRAQAARMLDDPRAERTVQRFFWDWLQLDGGRLHHALDDTKKNAELYPEYGESLQRAMRTAFEAYVTRVFFEEDGSFERLLTDTSAYVNGPLAELYGVEGGPTEPDDWQWVELPRDERAGLFTRAAFLTVFASAKVTSPIRRGVFVLEEVLCNHLGEPPPDVDDTPVEGGEVEDESGERVVRTVRQDVEARTQGDGCQSCHAIINPVGFTFEHYDAIGGWQDEERTSGLSVDASGQLQTSDVDGPVGDARELSRRLAGSEQVRSCFADRWISRALGRPAREVDECMRGAITEPFTEGGNMRELILSIVQSAAFRYVRAEE